MSAEIKEEASDAKQSHVERRVGRTIITSLSNFLWDLGFVVAYWLIYFTWQHAAFAK